jgi:hypothetical protein
MALYDNPDKTIVAFCDHQMLSGHALKAMKQTENVLRKRFPTARIVNGFDKLKEELIILLGDV